MSDRGRHKRMSVQGGGGASFDSDQAAKPASPTLPKLNTVQEMSSHSGQRMNSKVRNPMNRNRTTYSLAGGAFRPPTGKSKVQVMSMRFVVKLITSSEVQ